MSNNKLDFIPRLEPGYRSPLRPIPWEFVPETVLNEGCGDDASNAADSSTPDSWWLEAARLADKVEKKQDLSQLSMMVSLVKSNFETLFDNVAMEH